MKRESAANAYDLTQIIGNIANKYGYDGIIAPSQPNLNNGGINLIIFERGLN